MEICGRGAMKTPLSLQGGRRGPPARDRLRNLAQIASGTLCPRNDVFSIVFFYFVCITPSALAYDIEGTIRVSPPFPERTAIPVEEKHASCGKEQFSESLVISEEGLLQNAVISLEGVTADTPGVSFQDTPGVSQRLDQKNCHFQPHVLLVPKGHPFEVANSDPMAHDVRAFKDAEMLFRFEMDVGDKPVEREFEEAGRFLIRCGLHKWMHAYVISIGHPYIAVSDAHGAFKLQDVPAGDYRLSIWHEKLGEAEMPLKVEGALRDFSYTFPPPEKEA